MTKMLILRNFMSALQVLPLRMKQAVYIKRKHMPVFWQSFTELITLDMKVAFPKSLILILPEFMITAEFPTLHMNSTEIL